MPTELRARLDTGGSSKIGDSEASYPALFGDEQAAVPSSDAVRQVEAAHHR